MGSNAKPQPRWQRIAVTGSSMLPTLQAGDYLLLRRTKRFKPGQVVLLEDDKFRLVIKRLSAQTATGWWVLGDNPAESIDSRTYGEVNSAQLKAVAILRYWPKPKKIKAQL